MNTFRAEVDVVSLHGIPVAMRTVGTGEPLVILYRFRGTLVRWDPVLIDALARRRRVFDSLGVGDTPGEAPSTVEQMADFGADVLRPIGDSAVDVLGRSFGGLVAQKLAINEPRLVSSSFLPPPCHQPARPKSHGARSGCAMRATQLHRSMRFSRCS